MDAEAFDHSDKVHSDAERSIWCQDPIGFARRELHVEPWAKQREILETVRDCDRIAVRACNASGKTFIAALTIIWWLMSNREATAITTAPTERQVRQVLWREINRIHFENRDLIGGRITSTTLSIDQYRNAFGFSTNRPERFQGFHRPNCMFVVDEASGVDDSIFAAIEGSMTSHNPKLLMIGNPNRLSGYFYQAFHNHRKHWRTIHISAFETPNLAEPENERRLIGLVTRNWVLEKRDEWGEDSREYRIRILGEFPDNDTDTLIRLDRLEAAAQRENTLIEGANSNVMGIDVARFGDDRTVACIRNGNRVIAIIVLPNSDTMQTAGRAIDIARQYRVERIHVDEIGTGAGVLDRIREQGEINAVGINAASRARDSRRYANLRAEMYDYLRELFHDGEISIPQDQELISELASVKYGFTSRGQMIMQDKRASLAQAGKSPDKADSLMLSFAGGIISEARIWS